MRILIALSIIPLTIIVTDFVYSYTRYIYQEVNHTIRKAIKGIKSIWRVV